MPITVLAVDDDPFNLRLVSTIFSKEGYRVITADSGMEALQRVDEIQPDLIVLDVMMPKMDGYQLCQELRRRKSTVQTPILMLTAMERLEEKIKAFDVGADDFMTRPFAPAELQARARALLRRVTPTQTDAANVNGKVIAVFSLRGGIGVSTLAVNLAVGLSQVWNMPTALVDLDLVSGQSALMLNLSLRTTLANVAELPDAEIDNDLLNRILLPHPSGVKVLAAPAQPQQRELIKAETISHVLTHLKENYQYVVVDAPHNFDDTTLAGLDVADAIVCLTTPELASVRLTASTLDVFDSLKYPRDEMFLVLNWTFKNRGLPQKNIESVLKHNFDLIIPFASEPLVRAINVGIPVVFEEPTSPLGALFEDLAFALSKDEHQKQTPTSPTEAWHRVAQHLKSHQQTNSDPSRRA
jgi:pilus assembly protein CpaE